MNISNPLPAPVAADIVERLRKQARGASEAQRMMAEAKSLRQSDNPEGLTDLYSWAKPEETLEAQAAQAIAALTSELAEVKREREKALQLCPAWAARQAASQVNELTARAEAAEAEVARLTAKNKELLAALEPFVRVEPPPWEEAVSDNFRPWHGIALTMGDFRRARDLQPTKKDKDDDRS